MAEETIFEKILAKKIPSESVYEDDDVYAFKDIEPQAPTHVLVIPKRKIERFQHLKRTDPAEAGTFFAKVALVAEKLGLEPDGYRVVINNGKYGQQSVEYMHAHILGGRQMTWPPG